MDIIGDGFRVSWAEPPNLDAAPIVGYRVTRVPDERPDRPDARPGAALGRPGGARPARLTFLDRDPVRDRATAYDIASVDVFGRESTPKRVDVSLNTLARAAVPGDVVVTPAWNRPW